MIVSRIDGGLGNQMFQYAYGAYLAKRHDTELYLDTQSYSGGPQHGYLLDQLNIAAKPATESILRLLPRKYQQRSAGGRFNVRNWFSRPRLRRHKENPFGFQPAHLTTGDHSYLVGYWQSEDFFPGLRQQLLSEFSPRVAMSRHTSELAEQIAATNSITLHIRRGDYLSNSEAAKIYHRLDMDYYTSAVRDWADGKSNVRVFVFSNDIPWCKQQISLPWDTHFVDHTTAASAIEDMQLMRQAACNVIANSTFSWWAAWLNERSGVTYAPSAWFRPDTLDGSHILPPHWTRWRVPTGLQNVASLAG